MMEYNEEDFLLLSGIQHFAFCRRQWALIHIEQQWQENLRTVEGNILHEKAHDDGFSEKRGDIIISRGMAVFSRTLGVSGVCDIVELHRCADGVTIFGREGLYKPVPVEYKRGKPKENEADILQLCGQAMCLEEMLLCEIKEAYMFYGETRHRLKVVLDTDLRERVRDTLHEMHELYNRRYTPKTKPSKSCKACSLADICLPRLCKNPSVSKYIKDSLKEVEE
ncbi:CRISPR-associated protein Cas4 [Ruminiclostridium cellobioparum]|uniref:CRISPR-associated protein Cas4 n=1 Tax=Ruminiclostridium cellobioparum TaxID=29355 RepID=UPI000483CF72|nr:CRISPR-associated protein Cas4 [Ruminiclostridium cellobioparum]